MYCPSGYVILTPVHTHKRAERENGRWGEPKYYPASLLQGPSQKHSAHQRPMSTNPSRWVNLGVPFGLRETAA